MATYTLRQQGDAWIVDADYMRQVYKASPEPGSNRRSPKERCEAWIRAAQIANAKLGACVKQTGGLNQ